MSKCFNQYLHLSEGSTQITGTARDHHFLFRVRGEKDVSWESHSQTCKSRLLSCAFKADCGERGIPINILNLPATGLTDIQGRQHKLSDFFCHSLSLFLSPFLPYSPLSE